MKEENTAKGKRNKERLLLLKRINLVLEIPMIVLAFIWIFILLLELIKKTNPLLEAISITIWIIFLIDFTIKFLIAPVKGEFLKSNIITITSLIVPAFRVFRVFHFFRATTRGVPLFKFTRPIISIKLFGGIGRGFRALSLSLNRRAFAFVSLLTLIVLFSGATGMYLFERNVNPGIDDYGSAVWWTAMILTTMGSDSWPLTTEGRILCILMAVYAFTVFGYVTATFATFFLEEDTHSKNSELASSTQVEILQKQIQELKELIEKNNQGR